jgi:hypothetical protein
MRCETISIPFNSPLEQMIAAPVVRHVVKKPLLTSVV